MDTLSHGLWGGVAFGRQDKRAYWQAFSFGVLPDLLSFGIFTAANVLGLISGPDWGNGPPDPSLVPQFVHASYNVTHSLVVFALAFGLVWAIRRKPFLPMLAWPLHILMDIPTHGSAFFPTPFLWPISDFTVNGTSWSQPFIFIPNVTLLALAYLLWWIDKRKRDQMQKAKI